MQAKGGVVMSKSILQENFRRELMDVLEETFETHHGIFLDRHTSLFDTLGQIDAEEASIPVGNGCATIAAQVEHVIFYLEVLERSIAGKNVGETDWGEIWVRVNSVTAPDWEDIRDRLKATYNRISNTLRAIGDWEQNEAIGDAMAIVVHTAYHLGEIRQALCTIKQSE
jgi:hypothetical protein